MYYLDEGHACLSAVLSIDKTIGKTIETNPSDLDVLGRLRAHRFDGDVGLRNSHQSGEKPAKSPLAQWRNQLFEPNRPTCCLPPVEAPAHSFWEAEFPGPSGLERRTTGALEEPAAGFEPVAPHRQDHSAISSFEDPWPREFVDPGVR